MDAKEIAKLEKLPKIVNHKLVQVLEDKAVGYRVLISLEKGGQVETAPFPPNQQGLVGAMQIATEVMAGKVWLSHLVTTAPGWTAPLALQLEAPINTTARKI